MTVTPQSLEHLHQIHHQVHEIRTQLERGPRQVATRRQLLEHQTKALETARAELKRLKADTHAKELQVRTIEDKITGLRVKLNQAASNKEYRLLVDQIEADLKGKGRIEDEVLLALTLLDDKTAEIQKLEADLDRMGREFHALESTAKGQAEDLQARLGELEGAVAEAERSLPPDTYDAYRRLVAARGADALAGVEARACSGCHTSVTPQMYNELLMGRVLFCKSCGRMLYLTEKDF